ncbi:allene oxide cyclase barrel-like domain-containing protein [Modestobacter altitudinis]|uniref:allene oxide cyclase barrel-like domain-containing protein n=1 Tax=Modestobacter altitudinis TaxID=2213158 RepID=UPI00110C95C6|nr:hypothetical protein [Modestobacter altitudinis]
MTTRRTRRAATTATLVAVLGGCITLAATTAADADDTLRLTTVVGTNTDLDLGDAGPSAGDVQAFRDDVLRNGQVVGYTTGSCQVTEFGETRLVVACTATVVFADGSMITTQGASQEDPAVGPRGFEWAVTGGTGRYTGVGGTVTGEFVPDTDRVDLTIRLR